MGGEHQILLVYKVFTNLSLLKTTRLCLVDSNEFMKINDHFEDDERIEPKSTQTDIRKQGTRIGDIDFLSCFCSIIEDVNGFNLGCWYKHHNHDVLLAGNTHSLKQLRKKII